MSGADDVPEYVPQEVLDVIDKYYPESVAIAIVSQHDDDTSSLSMAGKYDDEENISADEQVALVIGHGLSAWFKANRKERTPPR